MRKRLAVIIMLLSISLLMLTIALFIECREKIKEKTATEEIEVHEITLVQEDNVGTEEFETTEKKLIDALNYLCGNDSSLDEQTAFTYIKEAADLGNSDAQYFTGEMYLQGIGTNADKDCAADYLKRAVESNNRKAFSIYAKLCFIGYKDIQNENIWYQDYEKVREIFEILDQSGEAEAAYVLGIIYFHGMCVKADYNLANAYFTKALDNGYTQAQEWKEKVQVFVTEPDKMVLYDNISVLKEKVYENEQLQTLVATYTEKLNATENFASFYEELENMKKIEPAFTLYSVLYGKNDWLFYQNMADGNSYNDYVGDPQKYFTIEEKKLIAQKLSEQKKIIEQKNAQFYIMVIPNKENIYSEYMPNYIERLSTKSRTDDLIEYLQANSDINIIYVKDAMMENKDKHQLYYYTDTHWNMKGTYIAVSELLKEFGKTLTLNDNQFISNPDLYAGDLGVMLDRKDRYAMDTVYNFNPATIMETDKLDKKALLVGDSFGEFLNIELNHYFKNGFSYEFVGNHNFSFSDSMDAVFGKEAVDVVIWECAERYIDRLELK